MPRAILEAFSRKIPIISSKSATCNLFTDKHLYISKGNNVKDYQICIEDLLRDITNGNLSSKLEFSLNTAKKYTEEKVVKKTISLYIKLMNDKSIPNIMKDNIKKSVELLP